MNKILFSDLISHNISAIYDNMRWENYELNNVIIEVTEKVKEDAIRVLSQNYGRSKVYPDILEDFLADVFIYFPVLLQQLAITRLVDSEGVVKDDINTTEITRNENLKTQSEQNGISTQVGTQNDNNIIDTQNKTTGTVSVNDETSNTQNSNTEIENISGTESTGTRSVNLSHNLPEQAIVGTTGQFPKDLEGTPILNASYVQGANEGFVTSNPITSSESSTQNIINSDESTSNSTTTNDISVENTGSTTRTISNNESVSNEGTTETTGINTISETVTSTTTNKQYAYEIKAFLETAQSTIAFKNWVDRFYWIEGIT